MFSQRLSIVYITEALNSLKGTKLKCTDLCCCSLTIRRLWVGEVQSLKSDY